MTAKTRKEQLKDMLADDPKDSFLRYGLAMEFVSEGNDAEAVNCLRELLATNPDYVPGYLQAGQALTRLNKPSEARDIFQSGIAIAQKVGEVHAAGEMEGFLENLD
jgi:Tfp pilus assembly protein PilF